MTICKLACFILAASSLFAADSVAPEKIKSMKADLGGEIDSMKTRTQIMVDQVFSFGELGFQEFETSKYLTGILEKEGFRVERGYAGIPTAWVATWGSGKPVIALGSDLDCIPQASQKPGVGYHDPIIAGAPGHGEGHNSGQALNITAALAVKKLMEREHMQGTLVLWPGVAEEDLGTKAYFVRAGLFKNVDICIFTHVAADMAVSYGPAPGNGMVSVEYTFKGESAHAAAAPWRGRSALDAVELMDVGWNFRREHLRLTQRSHYVITNGGDQPNVVPPDATVWYYFREADYDHIKALWQIGDNMAKAATLMTDTSYASRLLGSAWPGYFNKPLAEDMQKNIDVVGMPEWSQDDQTLAKALQHELKVKEMGLRIKPSAPKNFEPKKDDDSEMASDMPMGGGSDDIGDVSWNVPTVVLRFPSNIQAGPGHSWANGVSMATPIAHKGATAGAKVEAFTILDFLTNPDLTTSAWAYFKDVQTKNEQYKPLISDKDVPAVWLNEKIMAQYRPEMRKYYYDPTKYKTYLEQLGIKYPTIRPAAQ
jgi:aminobenzoyl-glutamate utilization protein B